MVIVTSVQQQILKMYCDQYLEPKEIANRRKTSIRAVYKILKKLREKGLLKRGSQNRTSLLGGGVHKTYYRIHGLQFDIKIIQNSEIYQNALAKGNVIPFKDHTLVLYKEKLEIYQGEEQSFDDNSINEAFKQALIYFRELLYRIESRYNVLILKDQYHNINIVACHIAEVNNGIAKELYLNKDFIIIKGNDGKTWFRIDYSKKRFKEAETVHPERFKEDAQLIFSNYLNDWRENKPMNNSQLQELIILNNPVGYLKKNINSINDLFTNSNIIKCLDNKQKGELEEYLFTI